MNATNNSTKSMKMVITTDKTLIPVFIAAPKLTVMKTIQVNPKTIACPAKMFANKRIIKAKGFVNMPTTSIAGIIGTGTFNHTGTSGQKISFQYSFVPKLLTTIKVQTAKTQVMAMFPVTLAPPGNIGIIPNKLLKKIKKKTVSR